MEQLLRESLRRSSRQGRMKTSLTGTFETKLELVGLPGGYELSGYPPPPDMEEVEED